MNTNIKILEKRYKNFLTKNIHGYVFARNEQKNTVNALQGPLCTAEKSCEFTPNFIGSLSSQTVSEAQRRANPDNILSFRNWHQNTTLGRNLAVLYVPNLLNLSIFQQSLMEHKQQPNKQKLLQETHSGLICSKKSPGIIKYKYLQEFKTKVIGSTAHKHDFSQLKSSLKLNFSQLKLETRTRNFIILQEIKKSSLFIMLSRKYTIKIGEKIDSRKMVSTQDRDSAGYISLFYYQTTSKLLYPKTVACQNLVTSMPTLKTSLSGRQIMHPVGDS